MEDEFILRARVLIPSDTGVLYLLVSAVMRGEKEARFLVFGPRSIDDMPEAWIRGMLSTELVGIDAVDQESLSDDDNIGARVDDLEDAERECLSAEDKLIIFSALQDDEGCLFIAVGRDSKELRDDSKAKNGDVSLWFFAFEDTPPPEVTRQVRRITALLKDFKGHGTDLSS